MIYNTLMGAKRAVLAAAIGLLGAGASHATGTAFTNPFTSSGQSSTYVAAFTATATGTLQGYFTGVWGTGFTDGLGVYTGATPNTSTPGAGLTMSSLTNKTAAFGATMFSINVTQGQTFYFVEQANQTGISGYAPSGGTSVTSNSAPYYVWSDEATNNLGQTAYSPTGGSTANGYSAMAYSQAYTVGSGGITGGSGAQSGTIAAGSYTYVGFNDWAGGPSNSYDDVSFLFNIVCSAGNAGCGSSGGGTSSHVPEPGSLALAALGLFGAFRVSRRAATRRTA